MLFIYTISNASLHEMYVCETLGHFQMVHIWANQDKLILDKMGDMIATGVHGISNSRLWCTYTHTNFLCKSRQISKWPRGPPKRGNPAKAGRFPIPSLHKHTQTNSTSQHLVKLNSSKLLKTQACLRKWWLQPVFQLWTNCLIWCLLTNTRTSYREP